MSEHAPGRLASGGKRLSSRNRRAVAVRSNRPAATRNKPAAAVPRNSPAGDRGTDAKADNPAYDRRASGVATTTMIVPAALMIVIPATMPVLGIRGGGYPQARDEHRRGQEACT